jgi:DHA1 family inner membrane transport protein
MPAPSTPRTTRPHARVVGVLVLAQFAGTSLWFAVNAVMPELQRNFDWPATAVGTLTSVLQAGFIAGTLVFALLAIADRFPARAVFLACALAGAGCTLAAWATLADYGAMLAWRFATGFCLAGIYPVGMKIAAQWYPQGLGPVLGLLIGALILGSASAHALPEPAHAPARVRTLQWRALATIGTDARVRSSVLGYFGHMWELYTLWVLMPAILATRLQGTALSWVTFAVLGVGGTIGCVGGGALAPRLGSARVAGIQLAASGLCGLLAPWLMQAPDAVFYAWLAVWGTTVSGDSPQFSALTARNAPPQAVGSVLTLANSIGFAISIASILLFVQLSTAVPLGWLLPGLAIGPALGLWALAPLWRTRA